MNRCSKIHSALNNAINNLLMRHARSQATLLDVGCWNGETTLSYGKSVDAQKLIGIEAMAGPAAAAKAKGIHVISADLENDIWQLNQESVDVVVCNQVFEHLKNIFLPFDEIARVLKTGGILVISVPNLASFHNRCMLWLGRQPSSIRIWGPHVRGYCLHAFTSFCLTEHLFELVTIRGVGFYPFDPKFGGNLIANIWKNGSHTPIWVLRRTPRRGASFHRLYSERGEQTLL